MKNKKTVMAFSAIQILIFHLWIPIFPGNVIEDFLIRTSYVGVDIFFFLSAYALSGKKTEKYFSFVFTRFKAVYIKFILFAVIAFLYAGWELPHLGKVISMRDLFQKGGGAFLWFLPAIMIFYAAFPLLQSCEQRHRYITLLTAVVIWTGIAAFATFYKITSIFIYWNRIPVFLLGFYLGTCKAFKKLLADNRNKLLTGLACITGGGCLMYFFGYRPRLQVPFCDMFYVVGIPVSLGLVLLTSFVPAKLIIKWIGSSTLEMYAVQMIFGYDFANWAFRVTKNPFLTNICSFLFVITGAAVFHYTYQFIVSHQQSTKSPPDSFC